MLLLFFGNFWFWLVDSQTNFNRLKTRELYLIFYEFGFKQYHKLVWMRSKILTVEARPVRHNYSKEIRFSDESFAR